MLRKILTRNSARSLRLRNASTTPNPPKQPQQAATPSSNPSKGGGIHLFPLTIIATAVAVGYTAYEAEVDPKFAAKIGKIPGANTVLDPFRSAIASSGLIPQPNSKKASGTKEPEVVVTIDQEAKGSEKVVAEVKVIEAESNEVAEDRSAQMNSSTENSTAASGESTGDNDSKETPKESQAEEDLSNEDENNPAIIAEDNLANAQAVASAAKHAASSKVEHPEPPTTAPSVKLTGLSEEEVGRLTDSKVLRQAIADSAREYIALRRDVESTLLKDIHQLSEHDLRIRLKQLATEMFERLAWEDLRLNQSLKGLQSEMSEKYSDLMNRQQRELELEVSKIVFAFEQESVHKSAQQIKSLEATYQKQLEDTVRAQAEGFHATLKRELEEQSTKIHTELQDELNHQVAMLRKSQVDELMALQPQLQDLHSELEGVKLAVDATADSIKKTVDIHQLSAAVLSLELALSSPSNSLNGDNNIGKQFQAVKKACEGDEVVCAVLNSLPQRVVTSGALPLSDLQVRFAVMREEVRKAALAPEAAPKMIGQLIGTMLAAISMAPTGMVAGPGAEETLSRAAYYLERGRIADTIKELDGVQGYAQVLMQDWKSLAHERLVVDQSIRVLKANAVIRHKSFK